MNLTRAALRSWRSEDAASLAAHANNRLIWRNVRDHFPHPYTLNHAREYLVGLLTEDPERCFAIDVEGVAVGSIGLKLGSDINRRCAEIGYWLSQEHWGKGIISEAIEQVVGYGFRELDLIRIYAEVFEWNPASAKVLEKAGFSCEGRMRQSAIKDGEIIDQLLYARIRT